MTDQISFYDESLKKQPSEGVPDVVRNDPKVIAAYLGKPTEAEQVANDPFAS